MVAGNIIPHSVRLPQVGGKSQARFLFPLQELQLLLSIVWLGHIGGIRVFLLFNLERVTVEYFSVELLTFENIPVLPQGFLFHPGPGLLVGGIWTPEPDQNQPFIRRGCRLGSVKHLQ